MSTHNICFRREIKYIPDTLPYLYLCSGDTFLIDCVGFNDMSTLVGHFVSSPKRDRREDEREERGTEMKVKK